VILISNGYLWIIEFIVNYLCVIMWIIEFCLRMTYNIGMF